MGQPSKTHHGLGSVTQNPTSSGSALDLPQVYFQTAPNELNFISKTRREKNWRKRENLFMLPSDMKLKLEEEGNRLVTLEWS